MLVWQSLRRFHERGMALIAPVICSQVFRRSAHSGERGLVPFERPPPFPADASQSPSNGRSEKRTDAHHHKAGCPICFCSREQADQRAQRDKSDENEFSQFGLLTLSLQSRKKISSLGFQTNHIPIIKTQRLLDFRLFGDTVLVLVGDTRQLHSLIHHAALTDTTLNPSPFSRAANFDAHKFKAWRRSSR